MRQTPQRSTFHRGAWLSITMAGLVLLGAQWGDEGKGKVTDYLAEQASTIRHDHMCPFTHTQFAGIYAFALQISDFSQHDLRVYYDAVSDHTGFSRIENSGGNQTQFEFFIAYHNGMTGIIATLIRVGIRIADLMDKEVFAERLKTVLAAKNDLIVKLYGGEPFQFEDVYNQYCDYADQLRQYVRAYLSI